MNIMAAVEGEAVGKEEPKIKEWIAELDDALAREKDWRKEAKDCVKLYEGGKRSEHQFNILFSNTETLLPALYNNTPRPLVGRRYKDADPTGKMAARVAQRTLEYLIDPANGDYTPFDDLLEQAVLEALVPGRGITRFKYDVGISEAEPAGETPATEGEESPETESAEEIQYQTVCGEPIPWDRFRHGYAKTWENVPWISIEHFMTREECEKNFPEIGAKIPLTIEGGKFNSDSDDDESGEKLADAEGVKLAHIFEIWDKTEKKVFFLCPAYKLGFLKSIDDPLELTGFFPVPKPLRLFSKISSLVPVTLYSTYEEQAKELNRVTVRINKLISALKVRGFYDSSIEGIDKVLQAEDNTLIPAENVAALHQGQTLEKAIWLMPLEKLIAVLQQLYLQRQQIKTVIYEITGISDILRGSSVASETATAQNIKNQWGTLRLKRQQKAVQRYVRECLRIMAEIAVTNLPSDTLAQMTGLQFPRQQEKQLAQMAMQQAQAAQQQPPAGISKVLTLPTWEELEAILHNDVLRSYKIDIETNSTVDAEATEDKADMGELMNAIAQFMNGVAPMIEQGVMPFEAAKAILLGVVRRYRFGPEIEDELGNMQAPKAAQGEDGPDPAMEKAKVDLQIAQQEAQAKMEMLKLDQQLHAAEVQAKMEDIKRKGELAAFTHQAKVQTLGLQLQTAKATAAAAAATPKSGGVNKD